jgi:hypothetical protein
MNFYPIENDTMVYPGEYLLHVPSQEIILCGAYKKGMGIIKGMARGRLMEDKIENFKKIKLTQQEHQDNRAGRCKGCAG